MSVKSTLKKIGAAVTKPSVIIATALTSPKQFITDPRQAVETFTEQPILTQMAKGAVAGTALGLIAAPTSISSLGAALGTTAGKAGVVAVAVPILAPTSTDIIARDPNLRDVAAGTAIGGPALGGVVALEKGEGILTNLWDEYGPSITDVAKKAGLTAGAAALAGAGLYSGYKIWGSTGNEGVVGSGETFPVLPGTQSISTPKRRYRARKAQKMPSVRQSVRININNSSRAVGTQINKKFIKVR